MAITKASLIDLNGQELILDGDADTSITADTDDVLDFKTGGTDRLKISGNNLHLNGGTDARIQLGSGGAGANSTSNDTVHIRGDGDDMKLMAAANGNYIFENNGSEKVRIRAAGGVAIGSAGYDSQILTVNSGSADNVLYGESTDANCFASFRDNSSSANIEFGAIGNNHVFRKDTTEQMRIDSSGNVGIGASSPSATDWGSASKVLQIAGTQPLLSLKDTDTGEFQIANSGQNLYFWDTAASATRMLIDAAGHITAPHQPAFLATKSSEDQNNFAVSSTVTITFDSEIFDQNADFASNTFTAPVTGRYQLNMTLNFGAYPDDSNYLWAGIITSNRIIYLALNPTGSPASSNYENATGSVLADMDANDTAYVFVIQGGGSQQTDILANSFFSGYLAC